MEELDLNDFHLPDGHNGYDGGNIILLKEGANKQDGSHFEPYWFRFCVDFDPLVMMHWVEENEGKIWPHFLDCVEYVKDKPNVDNVEYVMLIFNNKSLSLIFERSNVDNNFADALKYYESTEEYEVCQHIVDLQKEFQQ